MAPESGSLLFLRYSTISCHLNYGLFDMDPWLPVCGPDLSHELLTCVCNRHQKIPRCLPRSVCSICQKLISETFFQTSVLLPGPTPCLLGRQAKNESIFTSVSTEANDQVLPVAPFLEIRPVSLSSSPPLNAFLGLSLCPGLLPHLDPHLGPCSPGPSRGPLLTWTLTWALLHLDPCSPGHSPGPLLTWGLLLTWTLTWTLAHLDAHLGPHLSSCSPGPLLTWTLLWAFTWGLLLTRTLIWAFTWGLYSPGHYLDPCSPGLLLTWATPCFKACSSSVCFRNTTRMVC